MNDGGAAPCWRWRCCWPRARPPAAKATERSKQKQAAEAERAALQQKLTALKRAINQTESEKEDAADALAESEDAISDANRALRDLAANRRKPHARVGRAGSRSTRS